MHTILRNSITLQCQSQEFGKQVHTSVSDVLHSQLYPKLELLFEKYDVGDKVISIKELPLYISISKDNWQEELVTNTIQAAEKWFQKLQLTALHESSVEDKKTDVMQMLSRKRKLQLSLLRYLKRGTLSTSQLIPSLNLLFKQVEVDTNLFAEVFELFKKDLRVLVRFVCNTSPELQEKFNVYAEGLNSRDVDKIDVMLERQFLPGTAQKLKQFMEWYFQLPFGKNENSEEALKKILKDYFEIDDSDYEVIFKENIQLIHGNHEVHEFTHRDNLRSDDINAISSSENMDESKTWFISYAGGILLHPFLPKLFRDMGYTEAGEFKSLEKRHRAVLLTTYLSTFNVDLFENELLLAKLLCGVPLDQPVSTAWMVTEEEQVICNSLLEAVVEHWSILGNTSIKGLQESFLQRKGKLLLNDDGNYELTVEQSGIDVLLDQLPWGLGIIKTSYMEEFVQCHWN